MMMRSVLILLCLATPALAQQLPPLDPAIQLAVCQQQRAVFLNDSEQAQALMRQLLTKLTEAEAKVPPYPIDPNISD
jgi:hypothetical protein